MQINQYIKKNRSKRQLAEYSIRDAKNKSD